MTIVVAEILLRQSSGGCSSSLSSMLDMLLHSKWIEAICTLNATSTAVIEEPKTQFAQLGIPGTVVTNNGACFVSTEIEAFFTNNDIKYLTSAPYHPASNGLAEHAVHIVKKGLRKSFMVQCVLVLLKFS